MEMINYGIDLGTTNSGIAKYENGEVTVFKNPVGFREILPSVVSYRRGRIIVGDKAKEQYLSNAGNVFSAFKRKMGTNERFPVTGEEGVTEIAPIALSAQVLRELKGFALGEEVVAAVITIPASFDTIQSNATKEAGYMAGFSEVVLLQEPIAACLAYSNKSGLDIADARKWLVYDFGGGTFDVALVAIDHRELKVLDNRGNNFLGGVDIDYAFVEKLLVPPLEKEMKTTNLWESLIRNEGLYAKLWQYLLYLAEEGKKQLSVAPVAHVEIDFPELGLFCEISVAQEAFNKVVAPKYKESEVLLNALLRDNGLTFSDIERIILVGGSTYIPYIRDSLKKSTGSMVDSSVDPTTAVMVGAAFYAGAASRGSNTTLPPGDEPAGSLDATVTFESYTNDHEELIAFKTTEPFKGAYRITRVDGGFDSGWKEFNTNASEFVDILPKKINKFHLQIIDRKKRLVFSKNDIQVSHGIYGVMGQLLPNDICIELDDKDSGTYLDVIFKKNSVLPLHRTLYKTFSRSVTKGSDDLIRINVLEGKGGTLPGSNLSIGYIFIAGDAISEDLIKGTDIEIRVAMDESRCLSVEIYIPSADQELKRTFNISEREVSIGKLLADIGIASALIDAELAVSDADENFELSARFQSIKDAFAALAGQLRVVEGDRATEEKYRLDERKRELFTRLDDLTRTRDIAKELSEYRKEVDHFFEQKDSATQQQVKQFEEIYQREKEVLRSNDKHLIRRITAELSSLNSKIFVREEKNFVRIFLSLKLIPRSAYKDQQEAVNLFEFGDEAASRRDYPQLQAVCSNLMGNLTEEFLASLSPEARKQVILSPGSDTGIR